jgi:hypothetical protein
MAKKSPKKGAKTVESVGSKRYPYNPLPKCIPLAEIVKSHGGNVAFVPKSIIAKELQMDQSSSAFSQLVASAKTYGLVEGHQELKLTPIACDYFFPLSDEARRAAELEFFGTPPAFQHLISRYDGSRLPSGSIIANELGRNCAVPDTWRVRATSYFIGAAQELGVLDSSNFLRYSAAKHSAGSFAPRSVEPDVASDEPHGPARPQSPPTDAHFHSPTMHDDRGDKIIWVWGALRVEAPHDMTMPMWQRLDNYVQVIKPDETQGG